MMKRNNHTARNISMGLAIGAVAGVGIGMFATSNKKQMKKTANKAMKTVNSWMGDLSHIIG